MIFGQFPVLVFFSLVRSGSQSFNIVIAPGRYLRTCFNESVYVSRIYDFFVYAHMLVHAGSSPQVYTGLSPGEHRLKVVPSIDQCGRRRRPQVIKFTV